MKNDFLIRVLVSCFIFLSGCSIDQNKKANELYVKASQLMQSAITEEESYSNVLESYKTAKKEIESIISKYTYSDVAVSLISGQIKIVGFTLDEFKKLETPLTQLAEAEQQRLSCAMLVAKTIEDIPTKTKSLTEIAVKYASIGQKKRADQILFKALELAKTIEKAPKRIESLSEIAVKHSEIGQKEKANQILSQAFQIVPNEPKEIHNPYTILFELAVKYAKIGQLDIALEMAEKFEVFESESYKDTKRQYRTEAMAEIALKYAEDGQKEKANQIISQAINITLKIQNKYSKAISLRYIASTCDETGQLEKALEVAETIPVQNIKALALAEIALKYSEVGQKEKANQIISKALELAKTIEAGTEKAYALSEIAVKH